MPLNPPAYTDTRFYTGNPAGVPYDVQFRRESTAEVMQRMGTPVLVKHMYDIEDVEKGVAQEGPTFDDIYGQSTYASDTLSHGVGYVSVQTEPTEWYDPSADPPVIVSAASSPGPNFVQAPKYRGFGPGYLTYAILPDRPEDVWKLTEQGALMQSQTATVQFPWYPGIGDNDIVILVDVGPNGEVVNTYERYQLSQVMPITMRGANPVGFRSDWGGYREADVGNKVAAGNRFWVGQQGELVRLPSNDQIYNVEVDR